MSPAFRPSWPGDGVLRELPSPAALATPAARYRCGRVVGIGVFEHQAPRGDMHLGLRQMQRAADDDAVGLDVEPVDIGGTGKAVQLCMLVRGIESH